MHYYNELDKKAASWLAALIEEGLIPNGKIDTRSITDVQPSDLRGFSQCHFFAGIGGWPLALKLAGWPEARPVWTGSPPCQPLSCAGEQKGHADKRHLWPSFYRLIAQCGPPVIFGEQVASKDGREWFAGVRTDLEGVGYACGCADLCAASLGAPHIRQRLYWVADAELRRPEQRDEGQWTVSEPDENGSNGGMGDMQQPGLEGHAGNGNNGNEPGRNGKDKAGSTTETGATSFWSDATWHQCRDGKQRRIPVEPAFFPLAYGLPGRVAMLKGFGNAIVPQVAAEFIQAAEEAILQVAHREGP